MAKDPPNRDGEGAVGTKLGFFSSGIFGLLIFFSPRLHTLGKVAMEEAAFPFPEKYWDMETFLPLEMKGKGRKISKIIWNHKLGRENKLDSLD